MLAFVPVSETGRSTVAKTQLECPEKCPGGARRGASARLLRVQRSLFGLQIGNQLPGPVDRELIAYGEQYSSIPLNGLVDLDALLAHGPPPPDQAEATRPPVIS